MNGQIRAPRAWLTAISRLRLMTASSVQHKQTTLSHQVLGVWGLVSYTVEVQETGETFAPMGAHPLGYVIFTAEGRLSFTLSAQGRQPASTAQEQADLLNSMIAYTGSYRLEGDRWITQVDVAWNPAWVGTVQTRYYRVENDQLIVSTPWRLMPNWPEKGMTRSMVRFQRC
jgi:hypothetical protein